MGIAPRLDPSLQAAWLDLAERAHAGVLPIAEGGVFVRREVRGRGYLYHRVYDATAGRQRDRYLGPETPELEARIAAARAARETGRERAALVRSLVAGGLPAPTAAIGRLLAALAEAGLFRLRAVLVGTQAFAAYGPLLGVRLGRALQQTLDVDLAQPPDVSVAVQDSLDPPLEEVLRAVDARFAAIPGLDPQEPPWRFAAPSGLRVELLTTRRGRGGKGGVVTLPALQAGWQVLDFLDFALRDPVPAVALHGTGVPILVPDPARYAMHKLIVSARRREASQAKSAKDIAQAAALIEVLAEDRPDSLLAAWEEAWRRGLAWRRALAEGVARLPPATRARLPATAPLPAAAAADTA